MVKFSAIWLILLVYKSKSTLQDQYDNVILVHLHYDLTFDFERYGPTLFPNGRFYRCTFQNKHPMTKD